MPPLRSTVFAASIALGATPALAGSDDVHACDCKRRLGLCQAEARYDGARVSFLSRTDQCVRIAFTLGGENAAITIRHGSGSAAMAAPGDERGEVRIDGCYVCDVASAR